MKIAVVLQSQLYFGGGFQHELSTACLLHKRQDKWQFVFYTTHRQNIDVLNKLGIQAKYLDLFSGKLPVQARLSGLIRRRPSKTLSGPFLEEHFADDRIDLIYFLYPFPDTSNLTKTNFISTVLDLCHRDHVEFSEVRSDGEFETRETCLFNTLPKAVAVVTNFETLKSDIVRRYGCDPGRVYVSRFSPAIGVLSGSPMNLSEKYSIKNRYIFYPAQFWAHKNHVYLLDGLRILREKYELKIDAVFTGSDQGNLGFILHYAKKLGLDNQVHHLGFVPNEEMFSLYKHAIALVMPTFFGPTNIPPLEAFELECPVCYPNLPGLKDQVGEAAFLMDLNDPESMARHIVTILNDTAAVNTKIRLGKKLLLEWTEDDTWNIHNEIFETYANKMRCWKQD